MKTAPTKQEVRKALGYQFDSELAGLFGISRAAVSQWPEGAPIPRERWLELQLHHGDRIAALNELAGDRCCGGSADGAHSGGPPLVTDGATALGAPAARSSEAA